MKKLFVGNLPYGANETDVQNLFADAGVNVDSVTVMRDRFTGQARGFGLDGLDGKIDRRVRRADAAKDIGVDAEVSPATAHPESVRRHLRAGVEQ